ncbi:hypothetical protein JQ554_15790 [Bradyrhizobium diazoefficiens]|nr:hypothetical protein [Bradyrhizobium diazoefficiens]MBR0979243.1 hypothetical protein [Bradyrhizobium diazoefficiens]MBR1008635.1 hypothetical protein [Bradyrhizobium diazoefficiens]MBR1014616.1 hypothetical protein [Bradyrhizobium diazoefficiens]MBR1052596.1 hypothetical protein [Bradyrhizobium diazoefficiens]MBR1058643.1 hypothetical protein [Bradyrhizobium diazoefficiens]
MTWVNIEVPIFGHDNHVRRAYPACGGFALAQAPFNWLVDNYASLIGKAQLLATAPR